jgi:DNA-binding NarL/FixJ family response regulator
VNTRRVLIISGHPIFAQAIARLMGREAGIQVVGVASSLEEALPLVEDLAPHTVVVDYDDASLRDVEYLPLMAPEGESRQIIFLTLAGNEMVIHHRERMENVTPSDLTKAIKDL